MPQLNSSFLNSNNHLNLCEAATALARGAKEEVSEATLLLKPQYGANYRAARPL